MPALLDTSVLIRGTEDPDDEVAISVVSLTELHFGVLVAADEEARATRLRRLGTIEESFDPLPFVIAPDEWATIEQGLVQRAWLMDAGAVACPSFLTMTAYIDRCRNYAAVLFVEKPEEEKKPVWLSMKSLLDEQIPCK